MILLKRKIRFGYNFFRVCRRISVLVSKVSSHQEISDGAKFVTISSPLAKCRRIECEYPWDSILGGITRYETDIGRSFPVIGEASFFHGEFALSEKFLFAKVFLISIPSSGNAAVFRFPENFHEKKLLVQSKLPVEGRSSFAIRGVSVDFSNPFQLISFATSDSGQNRIPSIPSHSTRWHFAYGGDTVTRLSPSVSCLELTCETKKSYSEIKFSVLKESPFVSEKNQNFATTECGAKFLASGTFRWAHPGEDSTAGPWLLLGHFMYCLWHTKICGCILQKLTTVDKFRSRWVHTAHFSFIPRWSSF